MTVPPTGSVVSLCDLKVVRDDRIILSVDHLEIEQDQRWALLGPNGSGKSTLLSVLAGRLWPTSGDVVLLGERVGSVDLRELRGRLGLLSATLTRQLRPSILARDVVVTGVDGALETWWGEYSTSLYDRASELLSELGVGHLAGKQIGVVSEGERAKSLLARVLMAEPGLLCLDEPAAGLDLGAREELLARLGMLFAKQQPIPTVLVTHHVEELPRAMTHALLLRDGRVVASGPIEKVLTSEQVSATFGIDVEVTPSTDGRFTARAR